MSGLTTQALALLKAMLRDKRASRLVYLMIFISITGLSLALFAVKLLIYGIHGPRADAGASPLKWMLATLLPMFVALQGLRKKLFTFLAALMALALFYGCHRFEKKQDWADVLARVGMAILLALFYLIDEGSADLLVDFSRSYRASWLGISILGCFSCGVGDIGASEFGRRWSRRPATSSEAVPEQATKAFTAYGLLGGFCGGLLVGLAYYSGICFAVSGIFHLNQVPVILIGGVGGLVGAVGESVLRAIGTNPESAEQDFGNRSSLSDAANPLDEYGPGFTNRQRISFICSVFTALTLPKIYIGYF